MQTSPRREAINEIAEKTGTEKHSINRPKLSSKQAREAYKQLTGNSVDWENNRGWHLQQICNHLQINPRIQLEVSSNPRLPLNALKEIADNL